MKHACWFPRAGASSGVRWSTLDGPGPPAHAGGVASPTLQRIVTLESAMKDMAVAVARLSDEMREFKNEMRHDRRELSRQIGDVANAQGRLIEDIVAPSAPRLLRAVLGLPDDAPIAPFAVRLRLGHPAEPGRMRELDVVAGHGGVGLVVEVKSRLSPEGVAAFAASLGEARACLAPLGIREVIGGVATLYSDPSLVAHATRLGLLVFGAGEELIEPKNPPGFVPRRV